MTPMIEAHGLAKRFGKTPALDGLDLVADARPGRAQSSARTEPARPTFVRAVATLLRPDAGTLRVLGHDVRREPERVRRA